MLKIKRILAMVLALLMVCANVPWDAAASALEQTSEEVILSEETEYTQYTEPEGSTGGDAIQYVNIIAPEYQLGDRIPAADEIQLSVEGATLKSVNGFEETDHETFRSNIRYYLELTVAMPEGSDYRINWNGDAYWDHWNVENGELHIGLEYAFFSPRIENLYFRGLPAQIQAGDAVLPTGVSVEGEATIASMQWVDMNDQPVTVLETGKDYYLQMTMTPDEGYAFYDGIGAFNYATEFWSYHWGITGDGQAVIGFKYSLKPVVDAVLVEIVGIEPGADVQQVQVNISGNGILDEYYIKDWETWADVDSGILEQGKRYELYAEISPAEGYTITRDTEVTVCCGDQGVWGAYIWNIGELSVEAYYDFRSPRVEQVRVEGQPEKIEPGEVVIPQLFADGDAQVENVCWVDRDKNVVSVLEEGKLYFLEVTMRPADGYVFRDYVNADCDEQSIVSEQELKLYWGYSLLPDVGYVNVTINGVEPGKAVADMEVLVEGNAKVNRIEIWCEGEDGEITSGDFLDNRCYHLCVELIPAEGYRFTDENRPYVNGSWDGDCGQNSTGSVFWAYPYYDFRAPRVEEVWVYELPEDIKPGEATIPENLAVEGNAQITEICWLDAFNNKVTSFEDGKNYYLAVTLKPADGYVFRDWLHTNTNEHSIVDEQTLVLVFGYSLKPAIDSLNVTISGLEQGAPIKNIVADLGGKGQVSRIWVYNETTREEVLEGVFEEDNFYVMELELHPTDGYRFIRNMELTVENADDHFSWDMSGDGDTLWIYLEFDLRAPQVEEIYIEGLPEDIAVGNAEIPSLAVEGDARILSVQWVNEEDQPVSSFVFGKNYFLKVNLAPENGYVFRDWIDIDAYSRAILSEEELEVKFLYSLVPDVGPVDVFVSDVEPGMTVEDLQIAVNGNAILGEVYIHNNTTGQDVLDGCFEKENTYDITIVLTSADGYRFTDENRPLVNGNEDYDGWFSNYEGTGYTISLYYDLRTPAVKELGVNGLPQRFDLIPGAAELPALTVEGDAKITGVRWVDSDGQPVNAFASGKDYYLEVKLEPTNGLVFRDYIDFWNCNRNDDCQIVSEHEALAYFYFSLKPVCEEVHLDVSGLAAGNPISGISVHVSGDANLERIGVWDEYSGEYISSGKLQNGKYYMFRAELSVADGYRFGDETKLYFNGEREVDFGVSGNVLYVYYYFHTCQEIESIDLDMGKVKIGANIADIVPTAPKDANYTLGYRWVDYATWDEATGKFKDGCKYALEYWLIPNEGYAFAKNMKVSIGGEVDDAWINQTGSECQGNQIFSFYQKVNKVELPALPTSIKKGSKLPAGFKVSSNKYTLEYAWMNMYDDVAEKADKDGPYVLQWAVEAAKGYEFTSDTVVYVDGKKYTSAIISEDEIVIFKVFNINVPEITRLDLTVPNPAAGMIPGEITVPDGVKYHVYGAYWAQNATNNFFDTNDEVKTFENGKYVFLSLEMEAEEGYSFATDLEIYINGKKVSDPLVMNLGLYGAFAVNLGILGKAEPMQAPVVKVDGQMLTWNADSVATGYEVYRATSKSGKYSKVATVTETTWQDTSASVGKTYYYKVKAVNSANTKLNSGYSNIVSMVAKCAAPVIEVHVDIESGKPVVSWAKVAGAKKYEVYRAESVDGKYTKLTTTTGLSYTDTKAAFGSESYYKVKAIASKSTYNSDYSGIWMCYTVCARPNLTVKVNVDTGKPNLSWNKIANAVGYQILRQEAGAEEFVAVAVCEGTSFEDVTAVIGVEYTYKVQAVAQEYEGFNSAYSKELSAKCVMARPQLDAYVNTNGRPSITWEAVEDAVAYEVLRSTKSSSGFKVVATVVEGTAYCDEVGSVGTTYYYQVVAVGENAKSNASTTVKLVPSCAVPVADITTDQKTGKPVISWEKVSGAKSYDVYYATSENGTYKKLTNTKSTSYTDTKISIGATRYYKVRAVGKKSSYTSPFCTPVSGMGFCAQPQVKVTVDASTGKPALSWSKISGASSYRIFRIRNGYESDFVELTSVTGTSFIDATAPIDTRCSYMVQAMHSNEGLSSAFSLVVEAVSGIGRPAVKGSIDAATGSFVLTWDAVEGAVKYEVFRSTKSNKGFKSLGVVEDLTFEDTTAPGKTYYYKVTAIGEVSKSADMTAVKLTGKCATPVIAVENAANGKPSISWEKITGAKKYTIYRATSETGKYSKIGTSTKLTYVDTKATAGKTYFYKVVANASSSKYNSGYSNAESCLVLCASPALKVTNNASGQPVISWSKVSGAVKYKVTYQLGYMGGGMPQIIEDYTTGTSYTIKDMSVDMFGWVEVVAVAANEDCNSLPSEAKVEVAPATPKATGKVGANGKPVISWTEVNGAVTYIIYRSTKSGSGYKEIGRVEYMGEGESEAFVPQYEDATAAKGKTYYYKVEAAGYSSTSAMSGSVKVKSK